MFSLYEKLFSNKKDLLGKVVFITGASSGIGKALAESFARRGGSVALTARQALLLVNEYSHRDSR